MWFCTRTLRSILAVGLVWSVGVQAADKVKLVNDRPRNLNLVKELKKLCDANQKAKNELKRAQADQVEVKKEQVRKVNKSNTENFKAILKGNNWPSFEAVGSSGIDCVLLLVQETEDKALRTLSLPYIMNYYYIGALSSQKYALYIDRYFLRAIGYQLFGSHVNIQNNKVIFQPILDKPHVNNKRDMMGLIGIENYQAKIEEVYRNNQYDMKPLIQPDDSD